MQQLRRFFSRKSFYTTTRIQYQDVTHDFAFYQGMSPDEIEALLRCYFDLKAVPIGFHLQDGMIVPLSLVCQSPDLLDGSICKLLVKEISFKSKRGSSSTDPIENSPTMSARSSITTEIRETPTSLQADSISKLRRVYTTSSENSLRSLEYDADEVPELPSHRFNYATRQSAEIGSAGTSALSIDESISMLNALDEQHNIYSNSAYTTTSNSSSTSRPSSARLDKRLSKRGLNLKAEIALFLEDPHFTSGETSPGSDGADIQYDVPSLDAHGNLITASGSQDPDDQYVEVPLPSNKREIPRKTDPIQFAPAKPEVADGVCEPTSQMIAPAPIQSAASTEEEKSERKVKMSSCSGASSAIYRIYASFINSFRRH